MNHLITLFSTTDERRFIPLRLAIGVNLLFPIGGGINGLIPVLSTADWSVHLVVLLLRAVECLLGLGFVCGFGLRVIAVPTVLLFSLHLVSNVGRSLGFEATALAQFIRFEGDWAYGALYFGAAVLSLELLVDGAGAWSVDRAVYQALLKRRNGLK
jgi:uncharacterized membrane protein YphA (DoxX/SURF4 family)